MLDAGKTNNAVFTELSRTVDAYRTELDNRKPEKPVTLSNFSSSRTSSNGPFNTFGKQMVAVMRSGLPTGQTDPRLYNAATGLNETVPSDGGWLVQSDFSNQLLKETYETGMLAKMCNRIPISGNANSIKLPAPDESSRATGSRWGGITGYWSAEASEITASKPKFRQLELNLKKLVGLCYATEEVMQDAQMLEKLLLQGFASGFGFLIDDAIINGSGSGMPLGVMNSGCLVTQTAVSGQGANTVIAQNVIDMWARLLPGRQKTAVWLISNTVLHEQVKAPCPFL